MLTTRGLGPGPLLPTFGFGPLGFLVPDVPLGGVFVADPGTVLFRSIGGRVRFDLPCDDAGFIMEVPVMSQDNFKVDGGVVRFEVNSERVSFMVPPGTIKKTGKPK